MKTFDHIIVGTGQATGTLLGRLIPTGDAIAVIEGGKVGGSCVNYGCTPTKTLVASAKAYYMANRGGFYGFDVSDIRLDYNRVRERMNEIRHGSSSGLKDWMKAAENVTLIREWGRFTDDHTLQVGGQQIAGKHIYINTGTRPIEPEIEGIQGVPWMDSAGLLDLDQLPEHLIILGGGYIGMEFAQIYRRFGAQVTVIQRNDYVMPREDRDVAENIREILEEEDIEIRCGTSARSVSFENGKYSLKVDSNGEEHTIRGSHLLAAAGRIPNSDKLGLENTGIKVNTRGYVQVDDYCRTGVENVFAVGDVNGHGAFTHTSVNDAEIVLDHLYGGQRAISKRIPIYGLFTDPPLGRVGMTEKEALNKGYRVMKATRPMSRISRAREMGETQGFAKLIVDAETDLILGAAILGAGGDEIINMFAAIMHSGIPCRNYREVVLVHPTVSELMPWILDGLEEIK
jgi:pyruvate/2-oxoglutarate dehydrogenase complex dihydrolipoamide dehydrogenase (E3) component